MLTVPLFLIKAVLHKMKIQGDVSRPQSARRGFEKLVAKWDIHLRGFTYQAEDAAGVAGEWIFPDGCDRSKVLLYFHGGGYFAGSYNTHRTLVSKIVEQAGISALSINYRLAPEYPYPAAIDDCAAVYQWLLHEKKFLPEQIAFGGDSAGGGCVVNTLTFLRDKGIALPACAFALSPWLDLTLSGESVHTKAAADPILAIEKFPQVIDYYLQGADARSPYASPIFYSLKALPPVLVHVGSDEVLLSDSVRFAEKATAEGVAVQLEIYPGLFHVFHAFWRVLPKAREANGKLSAFLREHLHRQ